MQEISGCAILFTIGRNLSITGNNVTFVAFAMTRLRMYSVGDTQANIITLHPPTTFKAAYYEFFEYVGKF